MVKWLKFTLCFFVAGCNHLPIRHIARSPEVSVGEIQLTGDAKAPSKVDKKSTDSKISLPEGSKLEFNEKLGTFSVVMAKASEMAVNHVETAVTGPVAFTPDKGPTIAEEKEAKADFWTTLGLRAGLALGIAAAIFGLVRHWNMVMYGGSAIAGACLFGLFQQRHPILLFVIGLGLATAIAGPTIYHLKIKHLETPSPKPDDK